MARQRPSVQKRQREIKKRERERRKADKAARKRERREGNLPASDGVELDEPAAIQEEPDAPTSDRASSEPD